MPSSLAILGLITSRNCLGLLPGKICWLRILVLLDLTWIKPLRLLPKMIIDFRLCWSQRTCL